MSSWQITRTRRLIAALTLGSVLLTVACGPKAEPELDVGQARRDIGRTVSRTFHHPAIHATCPKKVKVRSGGDFFCSVTLAGHRLRVRVTQLDSKGNLRVEPLDAVIDVPRAAADLAARLRTRFHRAFRVTCAKPDLRVLQAGARFACQAADETSRRRIVVTVRDSRGSLDYAVTR